VSINRDDGLRGQTLKIPSSSPGVLFSLPMSKPGYTDRDSPRSSAVPLGKARILLVTASPVAKLFLLWSRRCMWICLFVSLNWEKYAVVLLTSCLRCFLEALGVCFVCLIAFVWPYLAICIRELQRQRVSVTFWQPLWVAFTAAMQRMPSEFVQLYFLTKLVMMTALMTGRNAMETMLNWEKWLGECRRSYVGRLLLQWNGRYWQLLSLERTSQSGVR